MFAPLRHQRRQPDRPDESTPRWRSACSGREVAFLRGHGRSPSFKLLDVPEGMVRSRVQLITNEVSTRRACQTADAANAKARKNAESLRPPLPPTTNAARPSSLLQPTPPTSVNSWMLRNVTRRTPFTPRRNPARLRRPSTARPWSGCVQQHRSHSPHPASRTYPSSTSPRHLTSPSYICPCPGSRHTPRSPSARRRRRWFFRRDAPFWHT